MVMDALSNMESVIKRIEERSAEGQIPKDMAEEVIEKIRQTRERLARLEEKLSGRQSQ